LALEGYLDVVRLSPLTLVFSVISHWFLTQPVVRGAIGADTSMASRLYHTPLRSAC
jgi:hypothetical protein